MATINKEAQAVIDRIARATENPPKFNQEAIIEAFKKQYELLGVPFPKEVIIAKGAVKGYKATWDAAWGAAWDAACWNTGLVGKDEAITKYQLIEEEMLKALENGLDIYFPMQDKLVLVPFPEMKVDEQKRLHSVEGPAVNWKGGVKFYFINGVKFDKTLWTKVVQDKLSAKEILKLGNMEQRMIALKLHGADKLLEELDALLLDKSLRGNELYLLTDVFSENAYFLKYQDPSTGRVYVSGIDPEVGKKKDADLCMAWKFDLNKEQYLGIVAEA